MCCLLLFVWLLNKQKKKHTNNSFLIKIAIADKLARRESLPKIAPIRRAYNVVADNTGLQYKLTQ